MCFCCEVQNKMLTLPPPPSTSISHILSLEVPIAPFSKSAAIDFNQLHDVDAFNKYLQLGNWGKLCSSSLLYEHSAVHSGKQISNQLKLNLFLLMRAKSTYSGKFSLRWNCIESFLCGNKIACLCMKIPMLTFSGKSERTRAKIDRKRNWSEFELKLNCLTRLLS